MVAKYQIGQLLVFNTASELQGVYHSGTFSVLESKWDRVSGPRGNGAFIYQIQVDRPPRWYWEGYLDPADGPW